MNKLLKFGLILLLAASISALLIEPVLGSWSEFVERVRTSMEQDLNSCEGEQRAITDSEKLADLMMPNGKCRELCQANKLDFQDNDYKYSGSTVLCCCQKA